MQIVKIFGVSGRVASSGDSGPAFVELALSVCFLSLNAVSYLGTKD